MEPNYIRFRKKMMRENLLEFLIDNLLPDYIDIGMLEDVETYVKNDTDGDGEYRSFCDYYELGDWFVKRMEECDFAVEDFFEAYAKEIEYRSED